MRSNQQHIGRGRGARSTSSTSKYTPAAPRYAVQRLFPYADGGYPFQAPNNRKLVEKMGHTVMIYDERSDWDHDYQQMLVTDNNGKYSLMQARDSSENVSYGQLQQHYDALAATLQWLSVTEMIQYIHQRYEELQRQEMAMAGDYDAFYQQVLHKMLEEQLQANMGIDPAAKTLAYQLLGPRRR